MFKNPFNLYLLKMVDKRGLVFACFLMIFLSSGVLAVDDLISLQGNVYNSTGDVLSSGNLVVSIYDAYSAGNLIYNSSTDFNNRIVNGQYDVVLGNGSEKLNLEFGKIYYMEMYVNNEAFTFNGSSRQVFQSSVGQINSTSINPNQINSSHLERNIDLSNASKVLSSAVNKSTGTNWVGELLDSILDNIFDGIASVNTTSNLQLLLNDTGIYSTYNATYAANSGGNASWNESYADTLYGAYQFTANNFNGSGNFTTTGKIGVGTEEINWTLDIREPGNYPGLGLKYAEDGFTAIAHYVNKSYYIVGPENVISIGEMPLYDSGQINTEWFNFTSEGINANNVNISASYFKGDGSLLTGISGGNASWNESRADTLYGAYQFTNNNFNGSGNFTTSDKIGVGTEDMNWSVDVRDVTAPTIGFYDTDDNNYTVIGQVAGLSYYLVSPGTPITFRELDSYGMVASTEWINFTSAGIGVTQNVTASYFKGDGSLLTGISGSSLFVNGTSASYINSIYSQNLNLTANLTLGENLYYTGAETFYINNGTDDFMEFNNAGEIGIYFETFISGGKDLYFENIAEDETIRFSGETGAMTTTGNATADYFIGDGSLLTGISGGSSLFITNGTSIYNSTALAFGFGISAPDVFMHLNRSFDGSTAFKIENLNVGSSAEASIKVQAENVYGQLIATSSTYPVPNTFAITSGAGSSQILYQLDNATGHHSFEVGNGNEIMRINSTGLIVTGNATATYFKGDGSLLTGISGGLFVNGTSATYINSIYSQNLNLTANLTLADKLIYTGASLFIANSTDTFAEFSNEGSISLEQDIYLASGKDFYFESVAEDVTITLAAETGNIDTVGNLTSLDCIVFDSGGKICSGA